MTTGVLTALFFFFVIGKGLRAQRLPVKVGKETMVGQIVSALTPIDAAGGKGFFGRRILECNKRHPGGQRTNSFRSAPEGLTVKMLPKT